MESRAIFTTFWTGHTGQKLSAVPAPVRVVATYLMTAPDSTKIGLYYASLPTIAAHTGINETLLFDVMHKLKELDFAWYDLVHEAVWVHEMCRYQYGDKLKRNDSRVGEIVNEFRNQAASPFAAEFYRRYSQTHHLPAWESFRPGEKAPSTLPSQESAAKMIEKQVLEVLLHYQKHHPRAKFDSASGSKEFRLIRDRLKSGFEVGELQRAIDGNHKSPWHCGDNPTGVKYHQLDVIFRTDSKTQWFIEFLDEAEAPAKKKVGL